LGGGKREGVRKKKKAPLIFLEEGIAASGDWDIGGKVNLPKEEDIISGQKKGALLYQT